MAARPKTLVVGICPVLMGWFFAYLNSAFHLLSAVAALLGAVLIQIGTNFANDYYDFKKGTDAKRVSDSVSPERLKIAFLLVFALAVLVGGYLVIRGGVVILGLGVLSILLGVFYTKGRFALAYTGLADIFAFLFFGPVAVLGTYYVQTLQVNLDAGVVGIAMGCFSLAILSVNNVRDFEGDKAAGKKTLVVRFGRGFGIFEYNLAMMGALYVPLYFILRDDGHFGLTMCLAVGFLAVPLIKDMREKTGDALDPVLGKTARLMLLFTGFFILGWFLSL